MLNTYFSILKSVVSIPNELSIYILNQFFYQYNIATLCDSSCFLQEGYEFAEIRKPTCPEFQMAFAIRIWKTESQVLISSLLGNFQRDYMHKTELFMALHQMSVNCETSKKIKAIWYKKRLQFNLTKIVVRFYILPNKHVVCEILACHKLEFPAPICK